MLFFHAMIILMFPHQQREAHRDERGVGGGGVGGGAGGARKNLGVNKEH